MDKNYEPLSNIDIPEGISCQQVAKLPEIIHIDDPAIDAMIDFKQVRALTVQDNVPIRFARLEIQASGAHILIVINETEEVVGVISSEDILGEKPIKISEEKFIKRENITVQMLMLPRQKILAVDFEQVKTVKVANIIQTMKDFHQHHMLVLARNDSEKATIRGLFSLSSISRQLHKNLLDTDLMATSLYELQQNLNL